MSAEIAVRQLRGVDVVQVDGAVDASNAHEVAARVAELGEAGRPIVFDLTRVRFLDSAGVRVLDDVAGAAQARGSALRVVAPERGPVALALRLTAFPEELRVPTVAEAVAALA